MDRKRLSKYANAALKGAGAVLAAVAIWYVGVAATREIHILETAFDPSWFGHAVWLAVLTTVALVLVAWAWVALVVEGRIRFKERFFSLVQTYALTNLLKYIPGNIFHYAGRQGALLKYGIPQSRGGIAFVCETGILCLIGFFFGGMLVLGGWSFVGLLATPALALGLLLLLRRFQVPVWRASASSIPFGFLADVLGAPVLGACALYVGVFIANGLVFYGICEILLDLEVSLFTAITASAFSWVIGFVTPGAPGGIGVREYALMQLLQSETNAESEIAIAAGIFRLSTLAGDVLFAVLATIAAGQSVRAKKNV